MTADKKSNISIVIAIVGSAIAICTLIFKFGGSQTRNDITYTKQEEMAKNIGSIKETTDWTKTTLIDHMKDDDNREASRVLADQAKRDADNEFKNSLTEQNKDFKNTIIEQNRQLLNLLSSRQAIRAAK